MKQLYLAMISLFLWNCDSGSEPAGPVETGHLWKAWERVDKNRIVGLYFDSAASIGQSNWGNTYNYIHPYSCNANKDTCFVSSKGGEADLNGGPYSIYDGLYNLYQGNFSFHNPSDSSTINWGGTIASESLHDIHSLTSQELVFEDVKASNDTHKFKPAKLGRVVIDTVRGNNAQVWPTFINYDPLPYTYNR